MCCFAPSPRGHLLLLDLKISFQWPGLWFSGPRKWKKVEAQGIPGTDPYPEVSLWCGINLVGETSLWLGVLKAARYVHQNEMIKFM